MTDTTRDARPFIVLTAIHDTNARAAAITLSHADAWERAQKALAGLDVAGLDLVELPVPPKAFFALKQSTAPAAGAPAHETAAVYDLFPLASHLDGPTRKVAGQFLAAEVLWKLEEAGILEGVPLNLRLDVPKDWDRAPTSVHQKLVEQGALDLDDKAIDTFLAIKTAWSASS
jgi:hypothetical protein